MRLLIFFVLSKKQIALSGFSNDCLAMTNSHMGNRYHDPVNARMHVRHMVGEHNSAIDNEVVFFDEIGYRYCEKTSNKAYKAFPG